MRVSNKGFKPKSQHLANGGMVKGAGTGTSDDIKKQVPAGSYIMPADSTEKIGAPSLGALGFNPQAKVPVNISNGEYELPPEQVHAVGVQALDQMKGNTHKPVAEKNQGSNPEQFFANGGEVDPNKYKPSFVGNVLQSVYPETNRVLNETAKTVQGDASQGNYGRAIGAGLGGAVKTAGGLGYDLLAHPIGRIAGQVGEVGKGLFGIDDSAAPSAAPVVPVVPAETSWRKPPSTASSVVKTVPNPLLASSALTAQGSNSPSSTNAEAAPQDQVATTPTNNVTRVGNSFSGSNIGLGFTVNGKASGMGGNPNSPQNINAVKSLVERTPTFGEGQPTTQPTATGFNTNAYQIAQRNADQILNARRYDANIERDNELRMIAPRSGANGQYTIAQQNARQHLIDGKYAGDAAKYGTDVTNAAGILKQQMSDQAATDRTAMQETGANYRSDNNNSTDLTKFGATNDLASRQYNDGADARGLQSQQARRMSKVLAQYDAAKSPEERKALSEQMQQLSGKEQPDRFTVVPGGQEIDPITQQVHTVPSRVFNNQAGQFVDQQNAAPPPIDKNPAVAAIVNNTKLSVEDKRKQLQAMGYK